MAKNGSNYVPLVATANALGEQLCDRLRNLGFAYSLYPKAAQRRHQMPQVSV